MLLPIIKPQGYSPINFLWLVPQTSNSLITDFNAYPISVSSYSTRGGNGICLAKELNHSETAYTNLEEGFDLSEFKKIDLIISAVDDHSNTLRETAILNGIACIAVSELADQISPTAFLSLHKTIVAPVVYAGCLTRNWF